MADKKTIACDKCGHRMEGIPEKCPACGETIRGRMDPHLVVRILKILDTPSIKTRIWFTAVLYILIFIMYTVCFAGIFKSYGFHAFLLVFSPSPLLSMIFAVIVLMRKSDWKKNVLVLHLPNLVSFAIFLPVLFFIYIHEKVSVSVETCLFILIISMFILSVAAFVLTFPALEIAHTRLGNAGFIAWLRCIRTGTALVSFITFVFLVRIIGEGLNISRL